MQCLWCAGIRALVANWTTVDAMRGAHSRITVERALMIKDIVVKPEHDQSRDSLRDNAISMARAFEAHVAGIAFA